MRLQFKQIAKYFALFTVLAITLVGVTWISAMQDGREWDAWPSTIMGEFSNYEVLSVRYKVDWSTQSRDTVIFRPKIDSVEIIIRIGYFDVGQIWLLNEGTKVYRIVGGAPEFLRDEVYREGWYKEDE